MAQSIVAAVEVFILFGIMIIRDHKLLDAEFFSGIFRIISVTGFTVLTAYIMVSLLPLEIADRGPFTLATKLGAITGVVLFVHFAMSALFDLDEVRPVLRKLKQIIIKPVRI